MGLEDSNNKYTPANKIFFHKDTSGAPCSEEWNYRSIVGMMLYLAGSTRPDISYAARQCERFSHDPESSHELGLNYIAKF